MVHAPKSSPGPSCRGHSDQSRRAGHQRHGSAMRQQMSRATRNRRVQMELCVGFEGKAKGTPILGSPNLGPNQNAGVWQGSWTKFFCQPPGPTPTRPSRRLTNERRVLFCRDPLKWWPLCTLLLFPCCCASIRDDPQGFAGVMKVRPLGFFTPLHVGQSFPASLLQSRRRGNMFWLLCNI